MLLSNTEYVDGGDELRVPLISNTSNYYCCFDTIQTTTTTKY